MACDCATHWRAGHCCKSRLAISAAVSQFLVVRDPTCQTLVPVHLFRVLLRSFVSVTLSTRFATAAMKRSCGLSAGVGQHREPEIHYVSAFRTATSPWHSTGVLARCRFVHRGLRRMRPVERRL